MKILQGKDLSSNSSDEGFFHLIVGVFILSVLIFIGSVVFQPFYHFWIFSTEYIQSNITDIKVLVYGLPIIIFFVGFAILVFIREEWGNLLTFAIILLIFNLDYYFSGQNLLLELIAEGIIYLF